MGRPGNILIVDDHPLNLQFLGSILGREGHRVSVAASGEEALGVALNEGPDLVISDLRMPGMDGFELQGRLRQHQETRDLPVIFLTASENPEDERRGLEEGAVDFLTKPVNPPVMIARVRTHLRLQDALRQLKRQNEILTENTRLQEEVDAISRHDLKNPLTAILALPEALLAGGNLTAAQDRALQAIHRAGLVMLEMVNRSLDVLKMERGTYVPAREPVDLLDTLRQVLHPLQGTMAQERLASRILIKGREALKGDRVSVQSDRLLLYSMFSNLVKNAVEASPPDSEVTIEIETTGALEVRITNRGEVPGEIRERFFENYSTSGKSKGTGLGTYSAHLIARTLGGRLDLDTSEQGSTLLIANIQP